MLFSCAGETESRVSAQMIPAAFPGLDYDCVCEKNNTSRGGFGRHKALGVVADLKTVRTVVKMCAWYARSPWEPKGPLT